MEELDLTGPSAASTADPARMAAWGQAEQLRGHDVVDVNGHNLGRVTRAFAQEGTLVRFDVTLSKAAKSLFGVERDFASIPPIAIAEVDEKEVRLSEAAEQVLDSENPRPLHAEDDLRGAGGKPRKTR